MSRPVLPDIFGRRVRGNREVKELSPEGVTAAIDRNITHFLSIKKGDLECVHQSIPSGRFSRSRSTIALMKARISGDLNA